MSTTAKASDVVWTRITSDLRNAETTDPTGVALSEVLPEVIAAFARSDLTTVKPRPQERPINVILGMGRSREQRGRVYAKIGATISYAVKQSKLANASQRRKIHFLLRSTTPTHRQIVSAVRTLQTRPDPKISPDALAQLTQTYGLRPPQTQQGLYRSWGWATTGQM